MDQFRACGLNASYDIGSVEELESSVTSYLENVRVNPHQYRREGECQNWLSHRYGIHRRDEEWVAVDREVVLGHRDEAAKRAQWGPIQARFNEFGECLPETLRTRFGLPGRKKKVGNELDLLLWQPSAGKFLTTEVKDGGDAAGVYHSPIQVAAYLAIWRLFVREQPGDTLGGLRDLLEQKIRLGLLPDNIPLPTRIAPDDLLPAVIVRNPNVRSTCWKTLDAVLQLLEEAMPDDCLDGLTVWAVQDAVLTEITQTWRTWV